MKKLFCSENYGNQIKTIIFMAVILFLVSGSTSAVFATTPKKGGTITVGLNTDMTTLDPHGSVATVNTIILNHVVEPLLGYGRNLEILPVLAERWEYSSDYKTYTFYLMQGKKFHNGREMIADDVKYSIERIMDPKTKCPRASFFKKVERIEVVNKYTVRIHLKEGFAGFPHVLSYLAPAMAILPKEEIEKQGGIIKNPVGTGPYKFVEWKPDRYAIVERFDQYKSRTEPKNGMGGERVAYLDRIKFVPVPEESVSIMALLNKEIDFLQRFPPNYVEKYKKDFSKKGIKLAEIAGLSWVQIFFGMDQPITKNLKFRQACAYAIDRQVVAQAGFFGHATLNASAVTKQSLYWTPYHNTWYKKDLEKAKQLLKEAGYNGEEVVIDCSKKYAYMFRNAVAVQSELAEAGIKTKLNVVDWPVLLKEKNLKGKSQMHSFGCAAMPNPALAYAYLKRNKFEELYPKAKELRETAEATADIEKRKKIFEELHKLTYEKVPWIMLFNYNRINGYQEYVKGYEAINTGMPSFWGVWLDK